MIRHDDGLVKVLDFGLAKLTEAESEEGGTRTTQPQTETGTIVGTVSYMDGKLGSERSFVIGWILT